MLSLRKLKYLPIVGGIVVALWFAHAWQINQREQQISTLEIAVTQAQNEISALRAAQEINMETIQELRDERARQNVQISRLQNQMDDIRNERDEYLSIFRRHDLTRLARARPGLIEPRINSGTSAVFRDIEADSREIIHRDEQNDQADNDSTD